MTTERPSPATTYVAATKPPAPFAQPSSSTPSTLIAFSESPFHERWKFIWAIIFEFAYGPSRYLVSTSGVSALIPQGLGVSEVSMLEYFLYVNKLSTPPSSHAGEAQDPPTLQVLEGHEEEGESMDLRKDAILPSESSY